MMTETKTLKLDSSFRPIEVIDAVEALVLCLIGKAQAIETYSKVIKSVNESFELPCVIALKRIVKFRYQTIPCHRRNVIWRDNNQCQYCSKHFMADKLTIDHVVPRSRGGQNDWLNLVTACKKCNQKKGDKTPSEANMPLIKEPKIPKSDIFKNISKNQIIPRWKYYLW
jgi:5-methylcytosine-specific restriction endonuclease McrA